MCVFMGQCPHGVVIVVVLQKIIGGIMTEGGMLSLSWNNHIATFAHTLASVREKVIMVLTLRPSYGINIFPFLDG